jgi:hypothetical protein
MEGLMKRLAVGVVAAGVILAGALAARAGTLEVYGASSRGTSMGGAMVAITDSWDAVAYNPSALALAPRSVSIQLSYINGSLIKNREDLLADGIAAKFGFNTRFFRNRIGVGLLVGMAGGADLGSLLNVGSLFSGGGAAPNWKFQHYSDTMPIQFAFGLGFRLADWLSVGVSLNQRNGLVAIAPYPILVDPIIKALLGIDTGAIGTNVRGTNFAAGGDPASQVSTGFNVTFRPIQYVSFGYSYTPEAWTRFNLKLRLTRIPGGLMANEEYYVFDIRAPGQVETIIYGLGGHIPIPWNDGILTLAWSHEIQNWDGFYPRSRSVTYSAGDVFTQESIMSAYTRDPGLKNIANDHYGIEYVGDASPILFWKLRDLTNARFCVRGGYYHWNSPQPRAHHGYQVAMMDSDADIYSFGLGFGFDRRKNVVSRVENPLAVSRVQIDLHVQVIAPESRNYLMRPDEWDSVSMENYSVKTKGNITNIGIQISWIN